MKICKKITIADLKRPQGSTPFTLKEIIEFTNILKAYQDGLEIQYLHKKIWKTWNMSYSPSFMHGDVWRIKTTKKQNTKHIANNNLEGMEL